MFKKSTARNKYHVKITPPRSFLVENFDGGVNQNEFRSDIDDNQLSNSVNMLFENGFLKTREGFRANVGYSLADAFASSYNMRLISGNIYSQTNAERIFLLNRRMGLDEHFRLLIIRSDGSRNIVPFYTLRGSHYGGQSMSVNCLCFSGRAMSGSGIFVLIGVMNPGGTMVDRFIYELNSTLTVAALIRPQDIYAPLVYVNGKGDLWNSVVIRDMTYPRPSFAEDFNMLSGGFRVGFKTDGLSTQFNLPFRHLSAGTGETIIINYTHTTGVNHTFTIAPNATRSNTVTLGNRNYNFVVDRVAGRFSTVDNAGNPIPLRFVNGIFNNLIILAYRNTGGSRLFRMTVSGNYNSRVFLSGRAGEGSVVCFSRPNNPLYFPGGNTAHFGENISTVTAMEVHNDRLIVFKANEVGMCSSISTANYDVDMILNGRTSRAVMHDRLQIKTISKGLGCRHPQTILSCSNRLVFLGSDNRVYAVTSNSNYQQRFHLISRAVNSSLQRRAADANTFAARWKGYYMLFVGGGVFLFDYTVSAFRSTANATRSNGGNSISWYYFEQPASQARFFSAVFLGNSLCLLARVVSGGFASHIFHYEFAGTVDEVVGINNTITRHPITCGFSTKLWDFNTSANKSVTAVEIVLGQESNAADTQVDLSYITENGEYADEPVTVDRRIDTKERFSKKIWDLTRLEATDTL